MGLNKNERAIAVAIRTFTCCPKDMELDYYEALNDADPAELASNVIEVWEPVDQFTIERLLEVVDNLINEIKTELI